ncbi:ABC transporter permease [Clostridium ljungdahlii]|uniref:ABC transporter permease n=2 Tax=Clostridium ljungdahlii TaxID=1538 RepID=UPI00386C0360
MNSYKEITNKYLKHNKKRTMLTILGVILSVALITAVGLFIESLQNSFVESAINQNGSYHVKIQKITADDYSQLKANPKIEKVGIQEKWFESNLKDGKKIEINKYNKSALEFLPKSYNAVKGRLPEKEGEIAIENWAFSYMKGDLKIGDTIKFETDKGEEKKFKITGIIQNQAETQYNGIALGMTYSTIFNIEKSAVYVSIYKNAGISNTVSELSNKFKGNCILNKDLLDYSGEGSNDLNKQLYGIAGVIIAIIVIATIAVIYNSFQISVIERMKQFGLLRAVGATPAQIRKIVLREASIISAIGIPLGLLSGIFAMFVVSKVFSIMSDTAFNNLKIVIPYYVLVISALVGVISIYLSAFIPARAASKVSPLVAISSRTSISKEKISKKRGNILKRFLNIESLMAFKNIKRNKKKFRVTVFSMVISMALFIFFSSFINMMTIFTGSQSEDVKMNFELIGVVDKNGASSLKENIINKVRQSKLVDKQYVSYGTYSSSTLIPNENRNDYLVKNAPKTYSDVTFENKKMSSIKTLFDIYDEDKIRSIKGYIKSGKVDTSNMAEENGVVIVRNNMLTVNERYYNGSIANLKVGDTIYIDKNMMYRPVQGEDYIGKSKRKMKSLIKTI